MSLLVDKANGYAGVAFPNEGSLYLRRAGLRSGEGKGIICLHGRGGTCLQFAPFGVRDFAPGYFAQLLAMEGYRVLAIDDMGGSAWGNVDALARIDDAYAYLMAQGATPGEIGLMGWSMGGMAALNWIARNKVKVGGAYLWCPATNLDYFHASPTYAAEINAAYPSYANDLPLYSPTARVADYRGVAPIKIAHAADDATIPVAQSQNFVNQVNDPLVSLRAIAVGGHTALFADVGDLEFVQHWKGAL